MVREIKEDYDTFFDLHSLGHEPATVQVDSLKKTLSSNNLSLANMICVSRDNPNVMKAVFRLLKTEAETAGCPRLIDAPCYLHPTHTSHQELCKVLQLDFKSFLCDLHGFFKLSTGRREDFIEVRQTLAEVLGEEFDESIGLFLAFFAMWIQGFIIFRFIITNIFNIVKGG